MGYLHLEHLYGKISKDTGFDFISEICIICNTTSYTYLLHQLSFQYFQIPVSI